jgi:hypothetical protein
VDLGSGGDLDRAGGAAEEAASGVDRKITRGPDGSACVLRL